MLTLSLLAAALAPVATPADTIPITEWPVPWENTRPRDPDLDAQGRVWFVGQAGNYVAYFVPASGEFRRYELDEGVYPHNVVIDAQGMAWYAGNRAAHIGRLDPATGAIVKYPMPDPEARDPHTLVVASDGNLWFTVQGGNMVGHLNVTTGQVRLVRMTRTNARPYGIVLDRQDRPWFVQFGTNRVGTIDPATFTMREYDLPADRARPRRLVLTSDGMVWYVDYTRGFLGRLDPRTGAVREWASPSGATSLPYAMAVDDRDRVWYVESGPKPNRFVGFDTQKGAFVSNTPILPSGAGTVRHMVYHAPTRTIWFGTDTNQLGRADVGTLP